MAEEHDVLMVTGLTPDPATTPPPPEEVAPAAPSAPAEPAEPGEQPAAPQEPPETTEAETDTAQTPGAPSEQPPEAAATEPPKKPARGVQKALDRLASQRDQAQRERDQALLALQQVLIRQQQTRPPPESVIPAVIPDAEPEQAKFPTWESYNKAVSEWTARKVAREETQNVVIQAARAAEQQRRQNVYRAQSAELQSKLNKSMETGADRFKDWNDVVISSEQPLTGALLTAIATSDDPAFVTHYLATHPEEHIKMLQMPDQRQFYEVGRIIAQANAPQVQASKAPPPARTVGGNKSAPREPAPTDDMTPAQWRAYVNRQGMTRGLK